MNIEQQELFVRRICALLRSEEGSMAGAGNDPNMVQKVFSNTEEAKTIMDRLKIAMLDKDTELYDSLQEILAETEKLDKRMEDAKKTLQRHQEKVLRTEPDGLENMPPLDPDDSIYKSAIMGQLNDQITLKQDELDDLEETVDELEQEIKTEISNHIESMKSMQQSLHRLHVEQQAQRNKLALLMSVTRVKWLDADHHATAPPEGLTVQGCFLSQLDSPLKTGHHVTVKFTSDEWRRAEDTNQAEKWRDADSAPWIVSAAAKYQDDVRRVERASMLWAAIDEVHPGQ